IVFTVLISKTPADRLGFALVRSLQTATLAATANRHESRPRMRRLLRQHARAALTRHVKARFIGHHRERIGQANGRFCRAKDEIAVARYCSGQAVEHFAFRLLIEIDQNIPAKDYVKRSERREIHNEILTTEFDHGTNFRSDAPEVGGLCEILDQKL